MRNKTQPDPKFAACPGVLVNSSAAVWNSEQFSGGFNLNCATPGLGWGCPLNCSTRYSSQPAPKFPPKHLGLCSPAPRRASHPWNSMEWVSGSVQPVLLSLFPLAIIPSLKPCCPSSGCHNSPEDEIPHLKKKKERQGWPLKSDF